MRKAVFFAAALAFVSYAAAAEFNLVPNRLSVAKPGEWVILGDVADPTEKVKISVVAVTCENNEKVVVIKRETLDSEDKVLDSKERHVKLSWYLERLDRLDSRAKRISREKMLVKDRTITVYVIELEDEANDRETKLWLSNDIPVGGFVRLWSSDPERPTYELLDFGIE